MSRNRIIYNVLGLFAGPAPASGYHFIDQDGVLNNNLTTGTSEQRNFNLLKNITRVQNFNYALSVNRTDILQLGKRSILQREIIDSPVATFDFDFLQAGLINEARLGFYVNYKLDDGSSFYSDNFSVTPIDGFINRTDGRIVNDLRWPMLHRDKRNMFLVVNDTQEDLKKNVVTYQEIDDNSADYSVYAFGNCYLTSYQARGAVRSFPQISVGYIAENLIYYNSGSGVSIPALDSRTRTNYSGIKFAVPTLFSENNGPSVLLPGDITIDIQSTPKLSGIKAVDGRGTPVNSTGTTDDLIDFRSLDVQSYNIDLNLSRLALDTFGHRLPIDREIQFPVVVNCDFDIILKDSNTGSVANLFNKNTDYNIAIKIGDSVRYDFLRGKFNSINYSHSIGNNSIYSAAYTSEIDPDDKTKGFFISGLLNIEDTSSVPIGFLLQENGDFILQENDDKIVIREFALLY